VHYSAFPSTFLSADIAKNYKVQRSRYTGLINISVLKSGDTAAQEVTIKGTAKNLLGVHKPLEFKRIKEGKSIYYLSELSYRNEETYQLSLEIMKGSTTETLKFQHTFFVE